MEQKGFLPSDDEEDTLPKVPTKLDVITVVYLKSRYRVSNIKLDRLKLYR